MPAAAHLHHHFIRTGGNPRQAHILAWTKFKASQVCRHRRQRG
uniref:Predicted protein n=1 Tax=Hordeum vulgare subsp. vulgare TaxID=112509 RepID=F2CZZ0_HORVV|nr:predicted protein [Hordeum vulgare subsp. vulgare]